MNIVIVAAGIGQRFIDAGYEYTKPLIDIDGSKVIDYVFDSFSPDDEYHVIVSKLTAEKINEYLIESGRTFKLYVLDEKTNGPSDSVLKANLDIADDEEVIYTYCDFGINWDYDEFKRYVANSFIDVCIPSYSGYHPHLMNSENLYAVSYVRDVIGVLELINIHEKHKPTNRFEAYHSPGIFYFYSYCKSIEAIKHQIENNNKCNNEFYLSLAINDYKEIYPNEIISVYPDIKHFYQFGTPSDLEYAKTQILKSKDVSNRLASQIEFEVDNVVYLSAGRGERFKKISQRTPKPFLPINGSPMIQEIITNNPAIVKSKNRIVAAADHSRYWNNFKLNVDCKFIEPNKIGAAYSYVQGCSDLVGSALIMPCDLIQSIPQFDANSDFVVFVAKPTSYQVEHESSFSWVSTDGDIAIKERPNNHDLVLIGSFYARSNKVLIDLSNEYLNHGAPVNGEYYLDSVFQLAGERGYNISVVDVGNYYSFGTPDEYNESCYFYRR